MTPMMNLTEFRDLGFLQEVNRLFFHPLGLALAVDVVEGEVVGLAGILDCREDPEGFLFGCWPDDAQGKADYVAALRASKLDCRDALMNQIGGGGIQPVNTLAPR